MVSVQLKTKEFYLVANSLLVEQSAQVFSLLDRIKTAANGQADDDLISVDATEQEIELVYRKLTLAPEGIYSEYNASMFAQLQTQIADGVAADNAEWISIGNKLQAIRTENLARADQFIAYAKLKLA